MIDREKLIKAYMTEYSMSEEDAQKKADETLKKLEQLYPEEFQNDSEGAENGEEDEEVYWDVSEVMCCKCFERWIAVRPSTTLLKNLECPRCKFQGAVIETGQEFYMEGDFEELEGEEDDDC